MIVGKTAFLNMYRLPSHLASCIENIAQGPCKNVNDSSQYPRLNNKRSYEKL